MTPQLITARMTARPPQTDDAPLLARIWAQPQAARWLSAEGTPWSPARIAHVAERFAAHWTTHLFGPWLWFENGGFVGYAGVKFAQIEGRAEVEALWGFAPHAWGRGLGAEAATAALAQAKEDGFARIVAVVLAGNVASQRLMEKTGFRHAGETSHAGLPHWRYVKDDLIP